MSVLAPPVHRGMTTLNREAFKKSFETLGVRLPAKKVGAAMKILSNDLLNQPRLRNIVPDPSSNETKLILFRLDLKNEEDIESLADDKKQYLKNEGLGYMKHTLELGYDYWTTDQILHSVMPEDTEVPSSFTQVGHIAHMNLRDELLPWKHLIGEVILDKNKNITSVVNKVNNIDTTFRFFKMEVLAGDTNMVAQLKEGGCRFKFDFSKVYWNSRLQTEHGRLVNAFKPGEYVCDVFAGVGPFALPATKKGCIVYANDLNPESYHWMNENIKLNKITKGIQTYNLDGREFIRKAVQDLQATASSTDEWKTFQHFVMNLPDTALEFLDAFRGVYRDHKNRYDATPSAKLPMIHCHCFTKSPEPATDIYERACRALGGNIDRSTSTLHYVRNVAPKKDMYCLSFPLTAEIAFSSSSEKRKSDSSPTEGEPSKTQKTS
ncbi:hypothetical protein VTP01DRAFT_3057 [Rhizomucor pusillus]|uniref:uncharacterized protein n=1 Tax=Rhizomucor pusillus TaxID=4840 RepID=UPI003744204E